MGDVKSMEVIDGFDDLTKVPENLALRKGTMLTDMVQQFATLNMLQDEVQMCRGLPDIIEVHDVGMVNKFHDDNFTFNG